MKIYIGIPIFGQADPEFISSLRKTTKVFEMLGHEVEVDMHTGCAIITKARNSIVRRFIKSGFDKLLFIDADMVWSPADAVLVLHAEHEFCGVAYRQKSEEIKYNVSLNGKRDGAWLGASVIGAGFISITKMCVDEMVAGYPETAYKENGDTLHALFDTEIVEGEYWGEDCNFCRRWENIGGTIWVLPADIGHIGKKIYRGNINETLMGS